MDFKPGYSSGMIEIESLINVIASGGTIAAVSISAIKYFHEKAKDKKQASENLYWELKDALDNLDGNKHPNDAYHVMVKGKDGKERDAYFINWDFNHDFYDSLVFSGRINFLEPKLQQPIQDIYKRIKTHNEYLGITKKMERPDDPVPEESYQYYLWLDGSEKKLREEIKTMLDELKKHFSYLA